MPIQYFSYSLSHVPHLLLQNVQFISLAAFNLVDLVLHISQIDTSLSQELLSFLLLSVNRQCTGVEYLNLFPQLYQFPIVGQLISIRLLH